MTSFKSFTLQAHSFIPFLFYPSIDISIYAFQVSCAPMEERPPILPPFHGPRPLLGQNNVLFREWTTLSLPSMLSTHSSKGPYNLMALSKAKFCAFEVLQYLLQSRCRRQCHHIGIRRKKRRQCFAPCGKQVWCSTLEKKRCVKTGKAWCLLKTDDSKYTRTEIAWHFY